MTLLFRVNCNLFQIYDTLRNDLIKRISNFFRTYFEFEVKRVTFFLHKIKTTHQKKINQKDKITSWERFSSDKPPFITKIKIAVL